MNKKVIGWILILLGFAVVFAGAYFCQIECISYPVPCQSSYDIPCLIWAIAIGAVLATIGFVIKKR